MSCIFLFLLILQFCVVVGLFNSSCFAEFMPKVELGKLRSLRLLLGKPTPTYQLHNGIKLFSKENLNLKSAELCFTQYLFFNFCTFRNYILFIKIISCSPNPSANFETLTFTIVFCKICFN